MWYSIDHRDGVEHCGSHSMHQTQSSSSLEGPILPGEMVTGCDVFLWYHGAVE